MKNQKSEISGSALTLTVVSPDAPAVSVSCESVRVPLEDDKQGRGGGLYGIRRGHADAILSIAAGEIIAVSGGKTVLSLSVSGGFARVTANDVTVTAEHAEKTK